MITNVRTEAAEGATFGNRDATLAPKNWASNRIEKRRGDTSGHDGEQRVQRRRQDREGVRDGDFVQHPGSVKNGVAPAYLEAPAGLAEPAALAEAEGLPRAESIREDAVDGALVVQIPVSHLVAKQPTVLPPVRLGEPA